MILKIKEDILKEADSTQAENLKRFFKTAPGEYGYGDKFHGIKVPVLRKIANNYYKQMDLKEIKKLLDSEFHEERFVSLVILIKKYEQGTESIKTEIFNFYIENINRINNWDLVDVSCPNIIGDYLLNKDKSILYEFSSSDNLWKRRISIISTFCFIRNNIFNHTIDLCKILINDKSDLIHKACGWMLRESGKRNLPLLLKFLDKNHEDMPRTMLRYSIEKLDDVQRKKYLYGFISKKDF